MKSVIRYFTIAAAAAFITSTSAFAKECCDATTAKVKAGEACEKCAEHACCKATARTVAKDLAKSGTKVGPCKTCAAKAANKKKAS
jgi:hypothetical protein